MIQRLPWQKKIAIFTCRCLLYHRNTILFDPEKNMCNPGNVYSCLLCSKISTERDIYIVMTACCVSYFQGPPGTWWQHPATFTLSLLWDSWRPYHHQSIQVRKTNYLREAWVLLRPMQLVGPCLRANYWFW